MLRQAVSSKPAPREAAIATQAAPGRVAPRRPVWRAVAAAVWLVVLAGAGFACHGAPHTARAPALLASPCPGCNVLLISVDTLRADHLQVYGYDRATSPNIDRFARQAVVFDPCINTGGGTLPIHASMFTSLPPTVHGVWADNGKALDSRRITLAEQLRDAGYRTHALTGGGYVSASFGLARGFDAFDESGGGLRTELPKLYDWLDSRPYGRFFVFLHTYDVHSGFNKLPYDHGAAWNRRFAATAGTRFDGCRDGLCASRLLAAVNRDVEAGKRPAGNVFSRAEISYIEDLYDGGVAYTDAALGRLFDQLKARGLWDRTVIVLTADHGEEFAEHGLFLHEQNHEEVARVPLLIRFPHGRFGGRRIAALVSTLEVMPTILGAVGIAPNRDTMGQNLVPLLAGERNAKPRPWVYIAGALEKLRTPDRSLFVTAGGPVQLFDLQHDPGETTNILAAHPAAGASLYAAYQAARNRDLQARHNLQLAQPDATAHLTSDDREHLRSLGYLR